MKHLLFAVALTATGYAAPIIVQQTISVSIAGSAWGILDGNGQSFNLTAAEGSLTGHASWTVTSPTQGASLPLDLYSWSSATVNQTATAQRLSTEGRLRAESWSNVGYPYASIYARSSIVYDVSFQLSEATAFAFDLTHSAIHGGGGYESPYVELVPATLSGPNGNVFSSLGSWSGPHTLSHGLSGVLNAGTYRLTYSPSTVVAGDPLGEFGNYDFSMSLSFLQVTTSAQTQAVPEGGGGVLLLLGLLALRLVKRMA